jgi:hypothetical protein
VTGSDLDKCHWNLVEPLIGTSDDSGGLYGGMLAENGFDLDGGDVLSTYLEHVLEPSMEDQTASLIAAVEVAGVEPPAGVDRFGGLDRILVVALGDTVAAHQDFSWHVEGLLGPGFRVDDAYFDPRRRLALCT